MADQKTSQLAVLSLPVLTDYLPAVQASGPTSVRVTLDRVGGLLCRNAVGGRLTLTSGVPVTTADVVGATSVYFTPYSASPWAGLVSVYDGTRWRLYTFTELTLALGSVTAGLPYDVFVYDNAGTLTLEKVAWTNATTRATALATQDGIYTKSGDATRRYLGTLYTTSTTATEDSAANRYCWNYYNRVARPLRRLEPTDQWTYVSPLTTWRQANASPANQVCLIVGVLEDAIEIQVQILGNHSASGGVLAIGIGEDSATGELAASTVGLCQVVTNVSAPLFTYYKGLPSSVGRHAYVWLEQNISAGTATFFSYIVNGGTTSRRGGMIGLIRS
jgi:hypothetical protein